MVRILALLLTCALATPAAARSVDPYRRHLARATVLMSRGRHKAAIRHLHKAARIRPVAAIFCDLGVARFKLALSAFRNRRRRDARRELSLARMRFRRCGRLARHKPKMRRKAMAGQNDVARLLKALR